MRGEVGFPVRLRYKKHGRIRWIGHRDLARVFERAFRVAALPLAFSEGFSPHPQVSFGLALSLGFESDAEYLDLRLKHSIDLDSLVASVAPALPTGIEVTGAVALADRAPSLQESVTTVVWRVDVGVAGHHAGDVLRAIVAQAMIAPSLVTTRTRKGREVTEDVRPALVSFEVVGTERGVAGIDEGLEVVEIECLTQPRSPKPSEVLQACASNLDTLPLEVGRVLRTHQWIERDGARCEPLDADPRPHLAMAGAT